MKKLFTILSAMLFAAGAFAATEQAWYNDVTSITANGQYYIYSVNGKGFMQAGQEQVKSITTSNYTSASTFKFKISTANQGYVTNGSYYVKSYMVLTGNSNSGPVCTKQSDDGTKIIWTSMNGGEYWNIHGYYNAWFSDRYPALNYKDNKYDGYMSGSGVNYSNTKDQQTAAEYRWYLVSQAQLDRHFAIYFFDSYKETLNIAQFENLVPASYYAALSELAGTSFNVQNAEHSAEVVNAAKTNLETLYTNAPDVALAYANAKEAIDHLENVEDKGEDFAQITSDIANARTAIEEAMNVEALNAAVAGLKAIDPITFQQTTFQALSNVNGAANTVAGRGISYDAANKSIINAEGKAIYAGTTTLVATAEATDQYYKFVRSAQVTVTAPTTYGDFERTTCDENVEFHGTPYAESFAGDVTVGKNYIGGDSIVHVNIVINHATFGSDTKSIVCGAEESWNGIDLSGYAVGSHTIPFNTTNVAGCDSTVTLTLTVAKQGTVIVPVELSFCEGGSVEYRDKTYTEEGPDEIQAIGSLSDTVYTITVTELKKSYFEESMTIEYGEETTWSEIDLSIYEIGNHDVEFFGTNVAGCDSVATLHLTVTKQQTLEEEYVIEFCEGDSAEYRGKWYFEAGEEQITAEGDIRDTLYLVTITVNANRYEELEPLSVKAGETIELPEGEWILGEETFSGQFATSDEHVPTIEFVQEGETEKGCKAVVKLTVNVTRSENVTNINAEGKAIKEFRNGTLYIRRGERTFTAEGREVK